MAFIRNTDKFVEGSSNKFFTDGRAQLALQPTVQSLESEDSGMKLRLDVIEGGAGVAGSIAKAQADAQAYADQKVAALINSAPEVLDTLKELSDAIGGDASFASTIAGQIGAVDAKVDQEVLDRQAAISALESSMGADVSALESADAALSLRLDELELDPVTKSYVDSADSSLQSSISSESSSRQSADSALSGRLDILEQDPTTKSYVDGEVSDLQGQISQEILDRQAAIQGVESQHASDIASVEGQIEAEELARQSADSALSGRLDVLEQDPVTKTYVDGEIQELDSAFSAFQTDFESRLDVLETDPVTKAYVDGEVSDLQGQITQEISDRQSAISSVEGMVEAEETRAMAAEGLLDGRLDILEQDPTTKTYVDSEVASEESRAMSAESALSGRLDVLELDPVSKTYVDGEISDLQGQVTTEKGRIDAILSASEADKDSFAEIVSLINSVDTSNDSAFAGYVLSNDAALAQEVSDRQSGDSALSGRLDIIEGLDSVEGSVAKAEKDAKDYADAAVLVEKNRAESAEGLLDGRLDVLESDPTTKSYVDSQVSSEASARQSADNALDSRLDVLESDPTTKSYVDSQVSAEASARSDEDLTMFKKDGSRNLTGSLTLEGASGKNVLWQTDGAGNIGAVNANRPNNIYVKTTGVFGGAVTVGGQVLASSGTASAPGFAFSGSVNSGMYFSSNAVYFTQGGSAKLNLSQYYVTSTATAYMSKGVRYGRIAVNTNHSITNPVWENILAVTDLSAPRTITLLVNPVAGMSYTIKDETGQASATNYIRIQGANGATIDGQAYYDIVVPYESIEVYCNGSNWFII